VKRHAKQDGDQSDEFEEDWTMVDEDEEIDVSAYPFELQSPVVGVARDASRAGGGALALGSMVMKGAQKRTSESAHRD
jgi:sterol 3beta-glucosyltransferase